MGNLEHAQSDAAQRNTSPRAVHRRLGATISPPKASRVRQLLLLTAALASLGIAMQTPGANSQQERMTACNAQAKSQTLSGSARKDFMQHCLAGENKSSAKELNSQQQKMKTCSAEAKSKGLKGADHKQFMSSCLKSSS